MGRQSTQPYDWLDSALRVIHKANWYRCVREVSGSEGPIIRLEGQWVINFASNDYLGLSSDDRVKEAAIAAIRTYGAGATGSRLLTGHRPLHTELEREIADWKQTDAALVFSSGYLANLTTIRALVDQRDLIIADEYNHSSLKNGAKLSGAQVIEFDHVNMDDLNQKLSQNRKNYRRCLILSDSVFSMDGDVCPLSALIAIAQSQDAMLLIDEAHATGVIGKTGSGCVEQFGCLGTPLIQVGTLSKALGSLGGYVAGAQNLMDYLRNRGAGWIYTTGLSPSDTAAALQALRICRQEPEHIQTLWRNIQCFKRAWLETTPLAAHQELETPRHLTSRPQARGGSLLPSESAIACLVVHSPESALDLSAQLLERGYWVPAIRPPTVPTSRLRISLMATHSTSHIEGLVKTLSDLLELPA